MIRTEQSSTSLRDAWLQDTTLVDRTCHEFRRPLAGISGFAELLEDGLAGDLSSEQLEYVRRIRTCVSRLDQSIRDFHSICQSWIEPATPAPVDVIDMVKAGIRRTVLASSCARVAIDLDATTPVPPITLDPVRLSESISRLLSHVVSAAPAGAKLLVVVGADDDSIHVSVRDVGPHLTDTECTEAFQYFARPERVRVVGDPGGSNLTVCRALVESMGGRTHSERCGRQETAYTLSFPIHLAQQQRSAE